MAIATPPTAAQPLSPVVPTHRTKKGEQTAPFERTLDWTPRARLLGILGGWTLFGMGVAYVVTMVAGFVADGNLTDPIKDPHLAIMELLILVQAPMIIVMFAAIHAYAGRANRVLSLTAFALVCLTAAITISVHFVLLTVGRQVSPAAIPGFTQLFSWQWPSVFYALDILAWDFCFGLALLAAAPVFGGYRLGRWVRTGMLLAGTLCLAGLAGVVLGNMQVRNIGIVGYGAVFPIVSLLVARVFTRMSPAWARPAP
jgi:hypothetical protein